MPVNFPIADFHNEFQFHQRAVEIVLLNFAFAASRRNIGVQERLEVLLQGDQPKDGPLFLGFLFQCVEHCARNQFRLLPTIEQIIPGQKRIFDIGGQDSNE